MGDKTCNDCVCFAMCELRLAMAANMERGEELGVFGFYDDHEPGDANVGFVATTSTGMSDAVYKAYAGGCVGYGIEV